MPKNPRCGQKHTDELGKREAQTFWHLPVGHQSVPSKMSRSEAEPIFGQELPGFVNYFPEKGLLSF